MYDTVPPASTNQPLDSSKFDMTRRNRGCVRTSIPGSMALRSSFAFAEGERKRTEERASPHYSTHVVPRPRRCKHGAPVLKGREVENPRLRLEPKELD